MDPARIASTAAIRSRPVTFTSPDARSQAAARAASTGSLQARETITSTHGTATWTSSSAAQDETSRSLIVSIRSASARSSSVADHALPGPAVAVVSEATIVTMTTARYDGLAEWYDREFANDGPARQAA